MARSCDLEQATEVVYHQSWNDGPALARPLPEEVAGRRSVAGTEMRSGGPKKAPATRPRKLAFGLMIALAVFAGAEGLLRLTLGPPPTPVAVTRAFAEQEHYFEREGDRVRSTYQRPSTPAFEAASAEPRVAVLGASSVHGGGAETPLAANADCWKREFPALMGEATGLPVLNLGTAGAASGDLLAVLSQTDDIAFDVLVVYTGHCDVGNAYFERKYAGVLGLTVRSHPLLERLQLFVQYRRLLAPIQGRVQDDESSASRTALTAAEIDLIHRDLRANLGAIVSHCENRGTDLVMVTPVCDLTFPPVYGSGESGAETYDLWSRGMDLRPTDPAGAARLLEQARDRSIRPTRAFTSVEHIVHEVAQQRDVTLVDARSQLPADPHGSVLAPWLFIDELHFSERGHAAMAALLGPVVVQHARGDPRE